MEIGCSSSSASRSVVRESLSSVLINLLATRVLIKRIEQLFNGQKALFVEIEKQFAERIAFMEAAANRFNKICSLSGESGAAGSQIDLDSLAVSAERQSEIMTNNLEASAEVSALKSLGRRTDARKKPRELVAKFVVPSSKRAQSPREPEAPETGRQIWEALLQNADEMERAQKAKEEGRLNRAQLNLCGRGWLCDVQPDGREM
jgi:hypothetical protein